MYTGHVQHGERRSPPRRSNPQERTGRRGQGTSPPPLRRTSTERPHRRRAGRESPAPKRTGHGMTNERARRGVAPASLAGRSPPSGEDPSSTTRRCSRASDATRAVRRTVHRDRVPGPGPGRCAVVTQPRTGLRAPGTLGLGGDARWWMPLYGPGRIARSPRSPTRPGSSEVRGGAATGRLRPPQPERRAVANTPELAGEAAAGPVGTREADRSGSSGTFRRRTRTCPQGPRRDLGRGTRGRRARAISTHDV